MKLKILSKIFTTYAPFQPKAKENIVVNEILIFQLRRYFFAMYNTYDKIEVYKSEAANSSEAKVKEKADKLNEAKVGSVTKGAVKRVYKPSPKHNPTSGWGSPDPIPDIKTGQKVLDTAYSSSKNKQLYNFYDGKLVEFQPDTAEGWHSYLVENPAKEVPADVLRQMLKDDKIIKVQYKNFIKNN